MRASSRTVSTLLMAFVIAASSPSAGAGATEAPTPDDTAGAHWSWPLAGPRLVLEPYRAPAHEYGAGHRGVDLGASVGAVVSAPADGTVAFRGTVVDRPILTIEHANGLVTTFEPLRSPLVPGDVVVSGEEIGFVDVGGHTSPGALHLGVRRNGDYVNPMLFFSEVPRAVLLPCCLAR